MSASNPFRRADVRNRILLCAPADVNVRLRAALMPVRLSLGDVLYEQGQRPEYLYFPEGAVISLLCVSEDGGSAEVGMTGNDGITGATYFLGVETMPHRAMVQVAGPAYKIRARLLQTEFARSAVFQRLVLRYIHDLLIQISQTALCNRLHAVEKRLSRWLLMSQDRTESSPLTMTQEFIAMMLGSRRESVTVAAARLQDSGLIHYSRGHITILDRTGLESAACECYRSVQSEIQQTAPAMPVQSVAGARVSRISNFRS